MESPSLFVENYDNLQDQTKTPRNKAQNSVLTYISNPKRERTLLGSSIAQQNSKGSQNKGQFVISYNFDHNQLGKAITHNIFIGWDDEPTKKSIKKPKPIAMGGLHSKTPIRNKMGLANKIISEQQQKQNVFEQTKRIREMKKQDKSLSKLPVYKSATSHSYLSNRGQNQNQTKIKQTYVPAIDRKLSRDKQLNPLQNTNNFNRNNSYNTLKPIENPIQNTERKGENQNYKAQRKTVCKKQGKQNYQNNLKLPSFQTSRQSNSQFRVGRANRNPQSNLGYRNGRTIQSKNREIDNQKQQQKYKTKKQQKMVRGKEQNNFDGKDIKIFNNADSLLWKQQNQRNQENIQKQIENNQYGLDTMKLIEQLEKMESENTDQNQGSRFQNNELNQVDLGKKSKTKNQQNQSGQKPKIIKNSFNPNQGQKDKKVSKANKEIYPQKQYKAKENNQKISKQKDNKQIQRSRIKKDSNESNIRSNSNSIQAKQFEKRLNQGQNKIQSNLNKVKPKEKYKEKQITNEKPKENKNQILKKDEKRQQNHSVQILNQKQEQLKFNDKNKKTQQNQKQSSQTFRSHDNEEKTQNQINKKSQQMKDNISSEKQPVQNSRIIIKQERKFQNREKQGQLLQRQKIIEQNLKQQKPVSNQLRIGQQFRRKSVAKKSINSYIVNIQSMRDQIGKSQGNNQPNQQIKGEQRITQQNIINQPIKKGVKQSGIQDKNANESEQKQLTKREHLNQKVTAKNRKLEKTYDLIIDSKKCKESGEKTVQNEDCNKSKLKKEIMQKKQIKKETSNPNKTNHHKKQQLQVGKTVNQKQQKKQDRNVQQSKCLNVNIKNQTQTQKIDDKSQRIKMPKNQLANLSQKDVKEVSQQIRPTQIRKHEQQFIVQSQHNKINTIQQHQKSANQKKAIQIVHKTESKNYKQNNSQENKDSKDNDSKPNSTLQKMFQKSDKKLVQKTKSRQLLNSRQSSNQSKRVKQSENNISIMNQGKSSNQNNKDKVGSRTQVSQSKNLANQRISNLNKEENNAINQDSQHKISQKSKMNSLKPNTGSSKGSNSRQNKLKSTMKQANKIQIDDKSKIESKIGSKTQVNIKKQQRHEEQNNKITNIHKPLTPMYIKPDQGISKQDKMYKQSSDSDSELQNTSKILNSQAPKQITCISKRSSFISHSSQLNTNPNSNKKFDENKSSQVSKSRKSDVKPINVRQFNSIAIQIGEGNINIPLQYLNNKINVSVGTSVKQLLKEEKNIMKKQSMREQNSEEQIKRQEKEGNKFNKTSNNQLNNGLCSEFVSFGNITCCPKIQPAQQQSFLNIQQNEKLNHTDFPPSLPLKQRKLNRNSSQSHNKNRSRYDRAPILSFIYGEEKKNVQEQSLHFVKSEELCPFQFNEEHQEDEYDDMISKAIQIILDIDSWLIDRIFEPYSNVDGDHFIWLYCKGHWKLFHSNNAISASSFIRQAISKAISQEYGIKDPNKLGIQQIIRIITGLRVMQLKNKKKLSQEIEYHLKKGNIIKGISAKLNNSETYNITAIESTASSQKLLQVRKAQRKSEQKMHRQEDNSIFWIKQQIFQKYFDYFLLICYREESHWTCKQLNNNQLMQTLVYTLDSLQNSIGSLQLHSDYELACKIDLYREVKPKLLKFVGSLNEKNKPIRSVQNPNSSICFNFSIKGRYYILISLSQLPKFVSKPINFSLECNEQVTIKYLESIQHETYKNNTSEYIEVNNRSKGINKSMHRQNRQKSRVNIKDKSILSQHTNKEDLREQFINYVMGKEDYKFSKAD